MNEDVIYKPMSMEEVAVELGASTVHTILYFSYCLQMLDFLDFVICKKEVNKKGENNNVNDKCKD